MARRWQIIRVELLSGRGERCEPPPGRTFILPPKATFDELGRAIDHAFARWDLNHLRQFEFTDGTMIMDDATMSEWPSSLDDAISRMISLDEPVKGHVTAADTQFSYTFDLGDEWFHLCTLEGFGDPADVYGSDPSTPVAIEGWGTIPDQYGRRWDGDDDDDDQPPPVVVPPELDRYNRFQPPAPLVDLGLLRTAADRTDNSAALVAALVDAISGVQLDSALHQVSAEILSAARSLPAAQTKQLESVLLALHNRATRRGWEGDDLLAEDLLATVQGRDTDPPLRPIPVDVNDLVMAMTDSMGFGEHEGGYLNTTTGESVHSLLTDDSYVDEAVDVEGEDWVWVPHTDSHTGWRDMDRFVSSIEDNALRDRFELAIEGRGAFRRFKDVLHQDADEQTRNRWYQEKEDRDWGRAREFLAEHGLRPV